MPAAVVVDKRAARAPADLRAGQTGFVGHVAKRAVAVVAVQHVVPPVGDEQVVGPAVVVVAHAHATSPPMPDQSGLLGDIGEGAITIVAVQPVGCPRRDCVHSPPVQDENVEPAIVVIVNERGAAADRLEDVAGVVGRAIDRRLRQARGLGHICEPCVKRQAGSLRAGLRSHPSGCNPLRSQRAGRKGRQRQQLSPRQAPRHAHNVAMEGQTNSSAAAVPQPAGQGRSDATCSRREYSVDTMRLRRGGGTDLSRPAVLPSAACRTPHP